ncbi:hypothetical protein GLAREA_05852 [Glarea lozoyensis ATCC 20868]|uniref:Uncharacterized protein n=1 Tax=Glarea lozoyensis (strain ATCC 20868 / MF5171) TaxID=1116229 RepID=S3D4Z4_GLAL2|nr:uncharacterized protein GLAREA_05852 [Glarea lozoyensis ATCC 20868]EPE32840.1 hypothetical protein GLAREA_05852 [Glarea lozoyensis ATCC 20868]
MGFLDFVSSAIGAIKDVVSHSPIVKALAPIAGIIAHAVPSVGPIIDTLVPALDGIFSSDNAAPAVDQEPHHLSADELSKPILVKLNGQEKHIESVLGTVKDLEKKLQAELESVKKSLEDSIKNAVTTIETDIINAIKAGVHETITSISNQYATFISDKVFGQIRDAAEWFSNHQVELRITFMDDDTKFTDLIGERALPGKLRALLEKLTEGLSSLRTLLEKEDVVASQQTLDLYLRMWQTGCNDPTNHSNSIIVTRGLYARKLFLEGTNWGMFTYESALLRSDTITARDVLINVVTNIPTRRTQAIPEPTPTTNDPNKSYIQDNWSPMAIGAINLDGIQKLTGLTEIRSHQSLYVDTFAAKLQHRYWVELANQAVNYKLAPARLVIQNLEDNIRQWNSRIPVSPAHVADGHIRRVTLLDKDLEAVYIGPKKGEVLEMLGFKPLNPGSTVVHPVPGIFYVPGHDLTGKSLSYVVTYSSIYGESSTSVVTSSLPFDSKVKILYLDLEPIAFDNDPLANTTRPNDPGGNSVAPTRAIKRRIYVIVKSTEGQPEYRFPLCEVDDHALGVYHSFDDPKPYIVKYTQQRADRGEQ